MVCFLQRFVLQTMKTILVPPSQSQTRVLVLETGEKVMARLEDYARQENVRAAHFTAIGAFRTCRVAYFDWETKDYIDLPFEEQMEVLVMAGDIAWKNGSPIVHAHVVLGRRDGTTRGGHLREACVRPTLEIFIEEGGSLVRDDDPQSELALIDPAKSSPRARPGPAARG